MTSRDEEIINLLGNSIPDGTDALVDLDRAFNEYGLDSLDAMTALLAIESKFGIKIPDADVDKLDTPNKVLAYVNQRLEN